tara:strand:+ start:193 stop:381 length:189 start_codon:yes stop_codon:yes gene_type:complete
MHQSNKDSNKMSEEQQIEEILLEAKAYGLQYEVAAWAEMLTLVNPKLNKVTAHQRGYDEWVE